MGNTRFNKLRLPDVSERPALAEAAGEWQRDIVKAVFGSLDADGDPLAALIPYAGNARTHSPEHVEQLQPAAGNGAGPASPSTRRTGYSPATVGRSLLSSRDLDVTRPGVGGSKAGLRARGRQQAPGKRAKCDLLRSKSELSATWASDQSEIQGFRGVGIAAITAGATKA